MRERPTRPFPARFGNDANMTDRQLAFIEHLAERTHPKRFLELGVYHGTTTAILSQIGQTVAVDWFRGNPEFAEDSIETGKREYPERKIGYLKNLAEHPEMYERTVTLECTTQAALLALRNVTFGLILIDANHEFSNARADIEESWPLLAPGGYLLLDDYSFATIMRQSRNHVQQAWSAAKVAPKPAGFETVDEGPPKLVAFRKP